MRLPKGWRIETRGGLTCNACSGTGRQPIENVLISPDETRFPLGASTARAATIARANPPRLRYACDGCGAQAAEWVEGWRWFGSIDEPPEHTLCPACPDRVDAPYLDS